MGVKEIVRPTTLILESVDFPFVVSDVRKPNYKFGLLEAAWMIMGSDSATIFEGVNPKMVEYSDDGVTLFGAYGPRLEDQMDGVLESIRRDPNTRQAVITTWIPFEKTPPLRETKDTPCTVAWHFQHRDGRLNLTVFMRSNDVWMGLPYDILSFTSVQRVVAALLGMVPGTYNHVVSNLHLYEPHFKLAEELANEILPEYIPVVSGDGESPISIAGRSWIYAQSAIGDVKWSGYDHYGAIRDIGYGFDWATRNAPVPSVVTRLRECLKHLRTQKGG